MGIAIQNKNRLPKKSRWPKLFSRCHEADGRSKMRRKRSDQRADQGAEATTTTTTGAEARAPETPAIIATPAQRPWRGNDERQWRLKRGVAPSLVRNQDRNRVLVQRSDHAPARCDQDLGQRRDRALRAAKRDPADALRGALALAAAREDRNRSALALVLRSVRAPRAAKSDLALVLRGALAPAPRSALAPDPRSALAPDAARNRAAEANRREGLRRDQRDQRARESAK